MYLDADRIRINSRAQTPILIGADPKRPLRWVMMGLLSVLGIWYSLFTLPDSRAFGFSCPFKIQYDTKHNVMYPIYYVFKLAGWGYWDALIDVRGEHICWDFHRDFLHLYFRKRFSECSTHKQTSGSDTEAYGTLYLAVWPHLPSYYSFPFMPICVLAVGMEIPPLLLRDNAVNCPTI
jgi:hypothetical protein